MNNNRKLTIFCVVVAGISLGTTVWLNWYTEERAVGIISWLAFFYQNWAPISVTGFALGWVMFLALRLLDKMHGRGE